MHIPGMATSDRRRPRGIETVQERAPLRGGKGGLKQTSSRKKWWSSLRQCKSRRSVVDVGRERVKRWCRRIPWRQQNENYASFACAWKSCDCSNKKQWRTTSRRTESSPRTTICTTTPTMHVPLIAEAALSLRLLGGGGGTDLLTIKSKKNNPGNSVGSDS